MDRPIGVARFLNACGVTTDDFRAYLKKQGIGTNFRFEGVDGVQVFEYLRDEVCGGNGAAAADRLANACASLGISLSGANQAVHPIPNSAPGRPENTPSQQMHGGTSP